MSSGTAALLLPDPETVGDLRVLVSRARKADPDGAARLVGHGDLLAVYVSPVHGHGAPTVLGLRTLGLAAPSSLDVTVPLSALADRLAVPEADLRIDGPDGDAWALPVPPAEAGAAWAGVAPPRRGWTAIGGVGSGVLSRQARAGVAEIAQGAGPGSGAHAVTRLRGLVWSRPFTEFGLPSGVAFAVDALAFAAEGETAAVYAAGAWTRLTLARGHVLSRAPLGAGLV